MRLRQQKNRWRLAIGFFFVVATLLLIFVSPWSGNPFIKIIKNEKDNGFALPQRQSWNGFIELPKKLIKLRQNLNRAIEDKSSEDDLGKNEFIQKEFERQISEIERIAKVEESLKLVELKLAFQDYSNKRLKEFELKYQEKANAMKELLSQDLQRKSVEINNQIKQYYDDLGLEHQVDLVNLQLQWATLDVNTNKTKLAQKEKIQAEIDQIRTEIRQKRAAQKEMLLRQLKEYETQQREQVDLELKKFKVELQTNYENDIDGYRAKLEAEFNKWRTKQANEFQKAIEIRQAQK